MKSKIEHLLNALDKQQRLDDESSKARRGSTIQAEKESETEVDGIGTLQGESPVHVAGAGADGDHEEEKDDVAHMSDDEIHVLMADIRKKLFHLKKSICEAAEVWNSK